MTCHRRKKAPLGARRKKSIIIQGGPRVGSVGFLAIGWFGSVGVPAFPGPVCGVFCLGGVGSVGSVLSSVRSIFGARHGFRQAWFK